ncbi:hypothetical protein F8S13_24425 [Chloroflexia bacterium SDU3-3]|nr:hypothetical protein F8S13_24425 [Chloroflexia bacterium SDU3-3]
MFQLNTSYDRTDIQSTIGGGMNDYLPHKNRQVVGICMRPDQHPDAPDILLIGANERVYQWACVFCNQRFPIPAFVREDGDLWRYVGPLFAEAWTENRAEIGIHQLRSGRADIRRVVFLMRFDDPRFKLGG